MKAQHERSRSAGLTHIQTHAMGHVCNKNSIFQVKQNSEKQKIKIKRNLQREPRGRSFRRGGLRKMEKGALLDSVAW